MPSISSLSRQFLPVFPLFEKKSQKTDKAQKRVGIIDIGSNSVRLVVYNGLCRVPGVLFNERSICGLGRGLQTTGLLNPQGVVAALETLQRFVAVIRAMTVERLDILATAAVREAKDGAVFVDQVQHIFSHPVRVLTGAEEGRLAAAGVLASFPQASGIAGDLGGGSLELAALENHKVGAVVSLPLGPLQLSDRGAAHHSKIRRFVGKELKNADFLKKYQGQNFYAIGGAWRVFARLHMAHTNYPLRLLQGYQASTRDIHNLVTLISRQSLQSLSGIKEIPSRRIEILPYAASVLSILLKRMKPAAVIFPSTGLREGCLLNTLPETILQQDPLESTALEYEERFGRFGRLGPVLEQWIAPLFSSSVAPEKQRLRLATCRFSDIAWREYPDYRAIQALQRILWMPLYGIDHPGRAYIALALFVRYGGHMSDHAAEGAISLLGSDGATEAALCGAALRLAYSASGGVEAFFKHSRLVVKKGIVKLKITNTQFRLPQDSVSQNLNTVAKIGGYRKAVIER